MEEKTSAVLGVVLISALSLLGSASCGGLQEEVEGPVREATQQVQQARDLQQQVKGAQQQRQRQLEEVQ